VKYAIVGTGSRHLMFRDAVISTYKAANALVGLCDANPHRLELSAGQVRQITGKPVAAYAAEDFDRMVNEQRPDTVIVTVPDYLHEKYIVRAMELGANVVTEKPMTTDIRRLAAVMDAKKRTGKSVTVSFNYRYAPHRTQVKDLLMSGVIGEITAVDFRWYLDRVHGADYFRRWHRYKDKSGGLLVHKATHHFDLINWWIASTPKAVNAFGKRVFYRPEMAVELGLAGHGERCHGCPVAERCDFRLDIEEDEGLRQLYLDAEQYDGYFRDRCVFAEDITIEDTMQVEARYASGATVNYTLVAYSPWEGLEVKFHGTRGELTHRHVEVHGVFSGKRQHAEGDESVTTTLHLAGEDSRPLEVWRGQGSHGGADPVMLGYIFDPANQTADRYGRSASEVMGAWSILTGIAANISIAGGKVVDVDALLAENGIDLARPG
jgi:predicted dehydrogenase